MLTHPEVRRARPRPQSMQQEYEAFIDQRVEEFKERLPRAELLSLGDEAVAELNGMEDQLVLTEVLLHEQVDRLIKKRLRLPTYRRWRARHVRLREAQRTPNHWGLDGDTPLTHLAGCLEEHDTALVVGADVAAAGYYLAAHDARVLLIDGHLGKVEGVESRVAAESLSARFEALVVHLGAWFPDDVFPALVVLDPGAVKTLDAAGRRRFVETVKDRTVPGGVHVLFGAAGGAEIGSIAPETLQGGYRDWSTERSVQRGRVRWFLARKP